MNVQNKPTVVFHILPDRSRGFSLNKNYWQSDTGYVVLSIVGLPGICRSRSGQMVFALGLDRGSRIITD